uniref:RNA-dependent RNA polymerase n=1 Tax=Riboviria sp. TaxID=2585031 RepID=A0A514D0D8_9VIRU|nr:MAG: RNA-dependent RNA polymerase [Riboviria sp.]
MSLHVEYQRKSGDATTAGGNGILNILSVTYAYRGTDVVWAVFMGDDSLVCARSVGGDKAAVRILAEVFNLGAKTFITDSPYFASNFLLIDDDNAVVRFVPDPVKRAARWSMSVSADDPMWHERWISARDACRAYRDEVCLVALPRLVCQRYEVDSASVELAVRAVAAVVADEKAFRSMWEEKPTTVTYG